MAKKKAWLVVPSSFGKSPPKSNPTNAKTVPTMSKTPLGPAVPASVAKKIIQSEINKGGGGGVGGFFHRIAHGAAQLPSDVTHAATVTEHAVTKEAPKVVHVVVHDAPRVARSLTPPTVTVSKGHLRFHEGGYVRTTKSAVKRTVAGGESAAAVADVLATGAENVGARLAIGGATQTQGLINTIKAIAAGHPMQSSTPDQPIVASVKQEGILPSDVVEKALPAAAKLGVGAAGAVAAFQHPSKAVPEVMSGLVNSLVGAGLLLGGTTIAATDPNTSFAEKKAMVAQPLGDVIEQMIKAYGPDASYSEVFRKAEQDPYFYGTNAAIILDPAAKALSVGYHLSEGATLADALKAVRVPNKERTLAIRVKGGTPKDVTIPQSQSPLYRGVVSRPGDLISKLTQASPGLRRLPISESSRAAKQLQRTLERQRHRMPAEVQSIFRDTEDFLGKRGNEHYAAALAQLMQKPDGFTDTEWLQASMADIRDMLEHPDRFQTPGTPTSPGVQRLLSRVKRYEAKAEDAATKRRSRASYRVSQDQQRLSDSLEEIAQKRSQTLAERNSIAKDGTKTPAERDTAVKLYDQELRALASQAKVARENLDDLSVNQEPITHPNRDQLEQVLERVPYFKDDPEAVQDMLRIGDARARVWAGQTGKSPDAWWNLVDSRFVHQSEIPADAYNQIALDLRRSLTPEQATQNLRYVRGGDLHKPELAVHGNKKGYRTLKSGERVQIYGHITPEDYVKRVAVLVPDQAERAKLAGWYPEVAPTIERFFGEDAPAILRGFAVSQANASPSFGITATMRVLDKTRRGEEVTKDEISAVSESIAQAVRGEHVSKGLAAKLHDFTDAIEGKDTRTWMGDDPRGGAPAPSDIHAIRDLGYIDPKLVGRLKSPERNALYKTGFKDGSFEVDSGSVASKHQYEVMREQYQAISDHMNEIGFDGRTNWKPAEVQALGWSAIQRLHGAYPENLYDAVASNTRTINLEVTKGHSGIGDDLSLAEATQVANAMREPIRNMIEDTPGIYSDGELEVRLSAYEGSPNASLHVNVIGSPEAVSALSTKLADTFDQYDVWATRESSSTGAKPTLIIKAPELADPEKALALYQELYNANPKKFAGFQTMEEDGVPGIALVMPGKAVSVASYDAAREELATMVDSAIDATLGEDAATQTRIANTQVIDRKWGEKHGKEHMGALQGARAERALDDPLAAQARQRLEDSVAQVREARGVNAAGAPLNQARHNDILGASQWLGSPDGGRILYLTEHADASTVVHELVGHATEEMHTLYPQEFAEVEKEMGKPYADWTVDDHEQFASWAERYFMDGHAPTPELVGIMDRTKAWMRSIYAGMTRVLGGRLPVATRVLLDSYFGAYDDVNVARVAMNMGKEGWGKEDYAIQHWGSAKVISEQELRTLKKSNETRRYNASLDGMVNKLDEMTKHLDDLWKKRETWSPEEQDEFSQLSADVLTHQAEIVVRADKREQALGRKLSDLEKSLQKGVDGRGFQGALQAMRWLSQDRERILRETFGDRYDEVFAGRRDLMADWLVSRGLLKSDYSAGTAHYFPMTVEPSMLRSGTVSGPAASLVSRTVGQTKTDMLKLHKRNQMILWQRGDWSADPRVLVEAHGRAQGYAWMNKVKQNLYDVGRPLTHAEASNLPNDVYLINLDGTPIGVGLRQQLRGASSVEDTHRVHDGLEGGDNDSLEGALKTYWDSFAIDPNSLPPGFDPTALPNLRVVPKSVVHSLLRPLRGGRTTAGEVWDWGTTVARLGLIYSNVPGYMITNAVGNLGFLLAQQGFKLPGILRDARSLLKNERLTDMIGGETGDLPAFAAISRGRGFSGHFEHYERKLLGFESIVDKYPRALAWKYEARKRGYKTDAQQMDLIKGATPKTARDREFVSETATNHMIDFNRLSPMEKQTLTRVLFIYPYVRGATAWPFWYAKQYPARAAIGADIGTAEYNRQQRILGPLPPWYSDLYPISRNGDQAQVIRTSATSPTSMAADELRLISDSVAGLLGRQPDTQTQDLIDNFSPMLRDAVSVATQKNDFGQDQSIRKTLTTDGLTLVPGWRLAKALMGSADTPRVFQKYDRGRQDQIMRTFVRIAPETVTVPWLNAQAQRRGTMTTQEKIDAAIATSKKQWAEVNPKETYNQYVDRATRMKVVFDDRVTEFARDKGKAPDFEPTKEEGGNWNVKYTPTEYERAVIAHAVLMQYYPKAKIPPPNKVLLDAGLDPTSTEAQQWMKKYMSLTWDKFIKPADTIKTQAGKKSTYEKIKAEKKAA